ncbi:MAG: MlaD family protein [bacterium]
MGLKTSYAVKVGFVVILCAICLFFILKFLNFINIGGASRDDYRLYFHFPSIKGLAKGAKFKINGHEVGYVEKTDISPMSGIEVSVRILNGKDLIHENAKVIITKESILGSSYIDVTEPFGGFYETEANDPDHYYIQIASGKIRQDDWIHYFHAGEEKIIGQVEKITIADSGFDRILVKKMDKTISVDKTYAFVPEEKKIWDEKLKKHHILTYVDVFPPLAENSYFQGSREATPEDLIAHVDTMVLDTGMQLKELNQEMVKVLQSIQGLLDDVGGLIDKDKIEELFDSLKVQIENIGTNIENITRDLSDMVGENKTRISASMQNIEDTTASIKKLAEDPELHDTFKNISSRIDSISIQIENILKDIEEISGDPQVKQDIKDSIHSMQSTLDTADQTVKNLQQKIDEVSDIEFKGQFKSRYRPDPDTYFSELDLFIHLPDQKVFYTIGLDDIGENNLLNLQLGFDIDDKIDTRFGVKRSRVGFGMDYHLNNFFIKTDLYDPNNIIFDAYAGFGLTDDVYILVGGEDLFEKDIFNLGILYEF